MNKPEPVTQLTPQSSPTTKIGKSIWTTHLPNFSNLRLEYLPPDKISSLSAHQAQDEIKLTRADESLFGTINLIGHTFTLEK